MLFGLGWPEWLTIIALVAGLWLTLKMMARASVAYEKARENRERAAEESAGSTDGDTEYSSRSPRRSAK